MELLPLAVVALAFWLLIVRPTSRRSRESRQLQAGLQVGDKIILVSGIYATLVELYDDRALAELAPGVIVEIARGGIAGVEAPPETPNTLDLSTDD